MLLSHPFPGNMRQLRHVLRLAGCTAENGVIVEADLDLPPFGGRLDRARFRSGRARRHRRSVARPRWRVTDAARALKLSRATLYRKIKLLKIGLDG